MLMHQALITLYVARRWFGLGSASQCADPQHPVWSVCSTWENLRCSAQPMRCKYGPLLGFPVNNSASNFVGAALSLLKNLCQAYLAACCIGNGHLTTGATPLQPSLRVPPCPGCCALGGSREYMRLGGSPCTRLPHGPRPTQCRRTGAAWTPPGPPYCLHSSRGQNLCQPAGLALMAFSSRGCREKEARQGSAPPVTEGDRRRTAVVSRARQTKPVVWCDPSCRCNKRRTLPAMGMYRKVLGLYKEI
jgi:hypothetical protein